MSNRKKLGLLQLATGPGKTQNVEKVEELLENLDDDLDLAITPEYLMGLEDGKPTRNFVRENAEPLESNFVNKFREKAAELGVSILFTMYRKDNDYYNSSVFVDNSGRICGVYDKVHLFDAFGHKESELFQRGDEVVTFDWEGLKVGLATCFDLRFPELFRIMGFAGADLVLVPSGFYAGSHKSEQWRTLIGSRAHENNFFVVAVNQPGSHFVGESMAASPLGYKVDSLEKEKEVGTVELDFGEVAESQEKMPMDELTRSEFYRKYEPYHSSK